jgi:hypothetical protein
LAPRVLEGEAMRELINDELNAVVGGVASDGKPYTPAQLDYIKKVLNVPTAKAPAPFKPSPTYKAPGQGMNPPGTPDILEMPKF